MTEKGYMKDIYKQLEECMKKCDNLSQELKSVKKKTSQKYIKEIRQIKKAHNEEVQALNKELKELKLKNEKLENEVDRLKKQLNNDSNNSSLPPSSDIKPNKKVIPNNREKSGKKVGGQKGHIGHHLSKKDIEKKINNKEVTHEVINVGKVSDKYISKYVLDIKIDVVAKEYRFYQDVNGKYNIPKEFKTDVQYGSDIKALCSFLNIEGLVAFDRLSYFVKSISQNKLNISNGSISNFIIELKNKSIPLIKNIEKEILNSTLMHTDATTSRSSSINNCVRTYSTDKYVTFDDEDFEDEDEFDDEDEFVFVESEALNDDELKEFNEQVELKMINRIRNNKYKNIIYLVLLEDAYEYIKSNQILEKKLEDFEYNNLLILENTPLPNIIKMMNTNDEFILDIFSLFYNYNYDNSLEDKFKNRKLIHLTKNSKYLEKFKIYKLDDMQYKYYKRRN